MEDCEEIHPIVQEHMDGEAAKNKPTNSQDVDYSLDLEKAQLDRQMKTEKINIIAKRDANKRQPGMSARNKNYIK